MKGAAEAGDISKKEAETALGPRDSTDSLAVIDVDANRGGGRHDAPICTAAMANGASAAVTTAAAAAATAKLATAKLAAVRSAAANAAYKA